MTNWKNSVAAKQLHVPDLDTASACTFSFRMISSEVLKYVNAAKAALTASYKSSISNII